MKRGFVVALVIGVALLTSAAGADTRTTAGKASLKLTRGAPVTLRGTGFVARERVRVTVAAQRRMAKRVVADAQGAFVVRFATSYDRCLGMTALAVGEEGSRARVKTPDVACPPRL